jgi:hypothetical protein
MMLLRFLHIPEENREEEKSFSAMKREDVDVPMYYLL